MKISKLEIERYIKAFKAYTEDDSDKVLWLNNLNYLQDNGFEYTDLLELLCDVEIEKIIKILVVLEVEIVWN